MAVKKLKSKKRSGKGGASGVSRKQPMLRLTPKQVVRLKKRVALLRERAGLSREELSEAIGCGRTYMHQFENTKQRTLIGIPALFLIAKVLKMSPSKVLNGLR